MKKGFTLIELLMVVAILGILAATALPRFIDLSTKAKESAAKGALGGIRAAVAIAYASNAAYGSAAFPSSITESMFADSIIPQEPFSQSNAVAAAGGSIPTSTASGWLYDSGTGRVWINHTQYSTY